MCRTEIVIKAIAPESLFSFTWHPYAVDPKVDYSKEEPTLIEFRLRAVPSGTLLTVTESGFERFLPNGGLRRFSGMMMGGHSR